MNQRFLFTFMNFPCSCSITTFYWNIWYNNILLLFVLTYSCNMSLLDSLFPVWELATIFLKNIFFSTWIGKGWKKNAFLLHVRVYVWEDVFCLFFCIYFKHCLSVILSSWLWMSDLKHLRYSFENVELFYPWIPESELLRYFSHFWKDYAFSYSLSFWCFNGDRACHLNIFVIKCFIYLIMEP